MLKLTTLIIWGVMLLFLGGSQNQRDSYRVAVTPACRQIAFDGSRFTICGYDPGQHEFQLILTDKNGRVLRDFSRLRASLGSRARRVAFAMNAGMYDGNGLPIGLYVENGNERQALNRRDGPGNFHLQPNGVFWIDAAGAQIADTLAYAASSRPGLRWATQSGPMLVIDGKLHPKFSVDGPSRYIRNGVGIAKGRRLIFVISDDPVSFGKFARLFRDRLGCQNALFLDGYVSSLWDGATGRNEQAINIGPMLVVSERLLRP
jgi:uncharacterized protein YigE (DUF2233 family)